MLAFPQLRILRLASVIILLRTPLSSFCPVTKFLRHTCIANFLYLVQEEENRLVTRAPGFSALHQSTASSTWWCDPRPRFGWVEMVVGLPEGRSYPGTPLAQTIFSPCCPLNDSRRTACSFFKIGRLSSPFSCLSLAHPRLFILLLMREAFILTLISSFPVQCALQM